MGIIAGAIGGFLGSDLLGAVAADAIAGAGIGAIGSSLTGGKPLTGALTGGLTGAAIGGLGGFLGDATGLGAVGGDALAGAGAGALGAGLTGQNPIVGGLEGGAGGAVAGLAGSAGSTSGTAVGGAGASAPGIAAPASISPDPVGAGGAAGAEGGSPLGNLFDPQTGVPVTPPIPPGSAGAGAATGAAGASSGFLGKAGDFLSQHAGSWLLPAGVIGYDALKANQGINNIPGAKQLSNEAAALAGQGQSLQSYLQTGTLPPGVQQSIDQAKTAAVASIKSQYASRGMSGSSAEAQDVAAASERAATSGAQIAQQLLQSGISETQLSSQIYSQLLDANIKNDNLLGGALATLAGAAARPTYNPPGNAG